MLWRLLDLRIPKGEKWMVNGQGVEYRRRQ